jgi:hypothetical protein
MSQCTSCAARKHNPKSGRYNMLCVHCCARLIRSARPLKHAQEALFAAIVQTIKAIDVECAKGGAA